MFIYACIHFNSSNIRMSRECKEKNNSVYTLSAYRFEQIINVKLKKEIFCQIIIFYQRLAKIITIFLI